MTTLANGDAVSNILSLTQSKAGGMNYDGTNTSFIEVDSQYTYTAPARFVLPSPQVMQSTAYMLPRGSTYVGFPWNGNAAKPPTAPVSTKIKSSVTISNGVVCNYAR